MDNITIGLEIQNQKTDEAMKRVERLLKTYDLWDFRNMYPKELSGGMRQRVALIRTLAVDPDILLLDEPFSALDYQTRILVSDDVYRIIKNEGKSAILVTHDITRDLVYKSATSENDIINSPKQNIDSSSELKDVDSVDINYTDLTTPELKENTFGQRLRKSRLELGLSVKDVADICKITPSVVNGYELERFYPSKEILDLLSSTFNVNYLCSDGYTNLILNYDIFIENLKIWISDNNFTTQIAADKLGVSRSLLRFWFNGGTMRISLYNKIKGNLAHYNLI